MKNTKKNISVMNDPKLDRIFTDAYRHTMRSVDLVEKGRRREDHLEAWADIFERDLANRDLTAAERVRFVAAFRTFVREADGRQVAERRKRTNLAVIGTAGVSGLVLIGFLSWAAVMRPFTPLPEIGSALDQAIVKVDEGYGEYAKRFYRSLDRYGRRLGTERSAEYAARMYGELDERFTELVAMVESGSLQYYDDARTWAGYFREPEERKARLDLAKNAFAAGLGKTVGSTVESVRNETKGFISRAAEFLRTELEKRQSGEQEQ